MRIFEVVVDNDEPVTFDDVELAQWNPKDQFRKDLIEDLLTAPVGYSTIEGGGSAPAFRYTRIK